MHAHTHRYACLFITIQTQARTHRVMITMCVCNDTGFVPTSSIIFSTKPLAVLFVLVPLSRWARRFEYEWYWADRPKTCSHCLYFTTGRQTGTVCSVSLSLSLSVVTLFLSISFSLFLSFFSLSITLSLVEGSGNHTVRLLMWKTDRGEEILTHRQTVTTATISFHWPSYRL